MAVTNPFQVAANDLTQLVDALKHESDAILLRFGEAMVDYLQDNSPVRTGALAASWVATPLDSNKVTVTNLQDYASFVHRPGETLQEDGSIYPQLIQEAVEYAHSKMSISGQIENITHAYTGISWAFAQPQALDDLIKNLNHVAHFDEMPTIETEDLAGGIIGVISWQR